MADPQESVIRLTGDTPRREMSFALRPDTAALAALRDDLGLQGLRKVALTGRLVPQGRHDWSLDATLGATVVQPCVVTLAPVTTRIDEPVARHYVADAAPVGPGEVEMPEDVDTEPLPPVLDLAALLAEALVLALPPWPRAAGVDFAGIEVTEPGKPTISQGAGKPFAGLARLKDKADDTE